MSSTPDLYQSNPVTVHAKQWTGENLDDLVGWIGEKNLDVSPPGIKPWVNLFVAANKRWLEIEIGEWIIEDELGFYPCKDVVFRKKYHKVLNREAELREKRVLTLPGSEWEGYDWEGDSEGFRLTHNGFDAPEATKKFKELSEGYDEIRIDHTK